MKRFPLPTLEAIQIVLCLVTINLCLPTAVVGQQETEPTKTSPRVGGKARLESWRDHEAMASSSRFKHLHWQRMGPKFVGGRVESIACPEDDLGTIFVGVGAGGVWKSDNGGLSWSPIFENQSTYSIGDIALEPGNPNTIWVGTGECHVSRSSYPGNGVFKSIDGGRTWQNMGLHESAHIGSVVIVPGDPKTVFVAAMGRIRGGGQRGIYRTVDGGQTFKQVLHAGRDVSFVDLVIDPFNADRVFASAWDRSSGNGSGVYRSDDGGETWKRLTQGLPEQEIDRVAIDVSRSHEGVVYALMADRSTPALARRRNASILFRSSDHGDTWERTHEGYVPTYIGWDFCDLRIAPDDENRLYLGGLRMITSNDGGKTFAGEGGFAVNRDPAEVFRLHSHRGLGVHLDVHDIWIDPQRPQRVLLGNDGGLFQSLDHGKTWLHLNSLPIAEYYRIHLDNQTPFRVWGGTQDNASLVGPSTARYEPGKDDAWQQVFLDPWSGGDGFSTFPDPHDSTITFYTQQNGDLKRSRLGRLRPEKHIRPKAGEGEKPLQFAWETPFFASGHGDQTVLYCAAQRVLKSTDRGDTWVAISPDFGNRGLLAMSESPRDENRLAAGGGRGKIWLTSDKGENWSPCGSGLPAKTVRDIQLSGHSSKHVYVALSGKGDSDCAAYLFRSNNYGKTWSSISGNLPAESINAIEEDPTTPGLLYAGTDLGVYVSLDFGAHWHSLCATLPTAPVVDLEVHSRDNVLVAATHGLSLFFLDVSEIRKSSSD